MARFDVYRNPGKQDAPFLLDVQCGLLKDLSSRVVVPLRRMEYFFNVVLPKQLSPVFEVEGVLYVMDTPQIAAFPAKLLKAPVTSLRDQQAIIKDALDFLFQGF